MQEWKYRATSLDLGIRRSGQLLASAALLPGIHLIGYWIGPSVGRDAVKQRRTFALPGIETGPSSP